MFSFLYLYGRVPFNLDIHIIVKVIFYLSLVFLIFAYPFFSFISETHLLIFCLCLILLILLLMSLLCYLSLFIYIIHLVGGFLLQFRLHFGFTILVFALSELLILTLYNILLSLFSGVCLYSLHFWRLFLLFMFYCFSA